MPFFVSIIYDSVYIIFFSIWLYALWCCFLTKVPNQSFSLIAGTDSGYSCRENLIIVSQTMFSKVQLPISLLRPCHK